jgi:hypothetical protein
MEKIAERMNWIRDLINAEEKMDETGVVDISVGYDNEKTLTQETLHYLQAMKNEMIDSANAFNELKNSPLGRIKIYGIAKTQADFMLFRNGYKMIFSLKQPGTISIRFNFLGPNQYIPTQIPTAQTSIASQLMEEHQIVAKKGPFNDLQWTYNDQPVQLDAVVRYHMSLFIKESAK